MGGGAEAQESPAMAFALRVAAMLGGGVRVTLTRGLQHSVCTDP